VVRTRLQGVWFQRVDTGFTFPLITLENPILVTDFEVDDLYCEMRASLTDHLKRPPSRR